MGVLKSFVELKRSGEDEIEQKEPLLRRRCLLKARGCGGNKQSAVSASKDDTLPRTISSLPSLFMSVIDISCFGDSVVNVHVLSFSKLFPAKSSAAVLIVNGVYRTIC